MHFWESWCLHIKTLHRWFICTLCTLLTNNKLINTNQKLLRQIVLLRIPYIFPYIESYIKLNVMGIRFGYTHSFNTNSTTMLVLWDPFSNEAFVKLVTVLVLLQYLFLLIYTHLLHYVFLKWSMPSPMALQSKILALFLFSAALSSCLVVSALLVKGKVSCFDCPNDYNYSGKFIINSFDKTSY